ncbi:MAG: dTMP kinase, partial [Pseudomonadota bacterium]|nr:dTMP kinase [Pseudomonadota bacterium]
KRLADFLETRGIVTSLTREPGGSDGGEDIRRLLVEGAIDRWDATAETLLHTAARRSHLIDLIEPARQNGKWVLCDRFADSTAAYQGYGQGLELDFIAELRSKIVGDAEPELTVLLDISVDQGLARASARGNIARYERMDRSIHEKIREGFLKIAAENAHRVVVIDADRSMDAIEAEIRQHTITRFGLS